MMDIKNIRYNNLDLLRILSTFAVIFIHVNWAFFGKSLLTANNDWGGGIINICTRYSVPNFAMLTGAMLLCNENNSNIGFFYKKSIRKIFLPSAFVIVLFIMYRILINIFIIKQNFTRGLESLFTTGLYNVWYVYMIAGVYLLILFCCKLKKVLSYENYVTLAFCFLIWAMISQPTTKYLLAYSIGNVFSFFSYVMIGDIIWTYAKNMHKTQERKSRNFYLIFVITLAINLTCIITTLFFRRKITNFYSYDAFIAFFSPTIVIFSISTFFLFSTMEFRYKLYYVSKLTLYIYLFHTFVLSFFIKIKDELTLNPVLSVFLVSIIIFFISLFFAYVFDKVYHNRVERFILRCLHL